MGSGTTVPEQRGGFHKLQKVRKNVRPERKGKEQQEPRRQRMEQAASVSQAQTATEAWTRLAVWAGPWREQAPESAATWERALAQTLVFSEIADLDLPWGRTTSW